MAAKAIRQTAGYLEAIKHLPEGGSLIVPNVSWQEYERLLDQLGDSNAVRVSYYRGRLEAMSPLPEYEIYKELLSHLGRAVADETGDDLESLGSTTFRKESLVGGTEPDTCFYVLNAQRIIGKNEIDLGQDPPPDVVVEIDITSSSTTKHEFYAGIGVPEIWRYDGARLQIFHLTEQGYVESSNSRAFPLLTADRLTQTLEQSKTEGQSAALRQFRKWLRKQLPSNS